MTKRCLSVRLKEHATQVNNSAIGKHLFDCEHAQYLANLQNQFSPLNDIPLPSGRSFRINHRFDCDSEGVVYLISCKSCGLQYVGNTITAFRLRFNNHNSSLNLVNKITT